MNYTLHTHYRTHALGALATKPRFNNLIPIHSFTVQHDSEELFQVDLPILIKVKFVYHCLPINSQFSIISEQFLPSIGQFEMFSERVRTALLHQESLPALALLFSGSWVRSFRFCRRQTVQTLVWAHAPDFERGSFLSLLGCGLLASMLPCLHHGLLFQHCRIAALHF